MLPVRHKSVVERGIVVHPTLIDDNDILHAPLQTLQHICIGTYAGGSLERIEQLVRLQPDEAHQPHKLFTELLLLEQPDDDWWREAARWIKYQETAEEDGRRWSKPHVTLLTLPALMQVKSCLQNGVVLLDHDATTFHEVVDEVLNLWEENGEISSGAISGLKSIFNTKKKHLIIHHRTEELGMKITGTFAALSKRVPSTASLSRTQSHPTFNVGAPSHAHTNPTFQLGAVEELDQKEEPPVANGDDSGSKRKISFAHLEDADSTIPKRRSYSQINGNDAPGFPHHQGSSAHMLKKLTEDTEGAVILCGRLGGVKRSAAAFVRLREGQHLDGLLEVNVPIRFLCFIATPLTEHSVHSTGIHEVAKAFGVLLTDEVYSSVAYRAREKKDLWHGVNEFTSHTMLVPPGRWDLDLMMEPPEKPIEQHDRPGYAAKFAPDEFTPVRETSAHAEGAVAEGLVRTGRLFGGLMDDIKRKLPFYPSDFSDGLKVANLSQVLSTSLFLFFALLTNMVTFGGVMDTVLDGTMSVIETLVSGCIVGLVCSLFSGQPLNVLSATGPVLIFEQILYGICKSMDWDFLAGRFWVGMWTALILLIIVATDMSAIVAAITRFTEESFATLISLLFIVQSFSSLFKVGKDYPISPNPKDILAGHCVCDTGNTSLAFNVSAGDSGTLEEFVNTCNNRTGSKLDGNQCTFLPDVFMFSCLLFFGTFLLIILLKDLKTSRFFPTTVRGIIANFSSLIAIVVMTAFSHLVGLNMPDLNIPSEFKPTIDRPWLVNPFNNIPFWLYFVSLVPALLFSILVFMDQQITAVIVNRKDHKLKKGFGYHLDLLVLSVTIVICSVLGIPFLVAATVISITHVQSLKVESSTAAPGEKPQFLGIREQRITYILSSILTGAAIFMTSILRLIPTPVLFGVFFFMGYAALDGQQLVDRILLLITPPKYQPDYPYLRVVPLSRVHLFTLIQVAALVGLYIIKSIKLTSMIFPLMLIVIVAIRKGLDYAPFFKQKELNALDHPVPSWAQMNGRVDLPSPPHSTTKTANKKESA